MSFTRPVQPTREEKLAARQARPLSRGARSDVVMGGSVHPVRKAAPAKIERKVRQSIRDSARGEECQVRIPGACWGDVIWSHFSGAAGGKGLGTKAVDVCGAFACLGCDGVYDGQRKRPAGVTCEQVELAWLLGHIRSLVILARKGLV